MLRGSAALPGSEGLLAMRLDEREVHRSNCKGLNLIATVVLIVAAWHLDVLRVVGF
jgi:hypothetical protein